MATMATPTAAATASVRGVYRELLRLAKRASQKHQQVEELRSSFRKPINANETIEQRLQYAETRLAFLRMTTTKTKRGGGGGSDTSAGGGTWVYKDGQRLEAGEKGTLRDSKGKVVSNWDGKNLDPESVRTHKQQLKRMGFTDNYHAKGVF